jgi:hypothetical protein
MVDLSPGDSRIDNIVVATPGLFHENRSKFCVENIVVRFKQLQYSFKVTKDLVGCEQSDGDDGIRVDGFLDGSLAQVSMVLRDWAPNCDIYSPVSEDELDTEAQRRRIW